jgi:hypothetical protein
MGGKLVGFPSLRFCSSDLERRADDSGMSRAWDQLAIGTVNVNDMSQESYRTISEYHSMA